MNILLFIHIVIALLLIAVILLQRTSSDGLTSIGSSVGGGMGIVTARSATNFLTKTTVILAAIFLINSIILANLSTKKNTSIENKIDQIESKEDTSVPLAK